ncbi:MAG: Dabb family protein [Flavobacteriaceae bacterium]
MKLAIYVNRRGRIKGIAPLLAGILIMIASCGQAPTTEETFDPTFTHVVYFWLKNPQDAKDQKTFEAHLTSFLERSEYAKTNFIGTPPKATRDVVDDSFTYALILSFESAEAQEKYQDEPAHVKFVNDAKHLWKKVIVYDAEGI